MSRVSELAQRARKGETGGAGMGERAEGGRERGGYYVDVIQKRERMLHLLKRLPRKIAVSRMATSLVLARLGSLHQPRPLSAHPSSLLCRWRCSRHSNYAAFIFNLFLEITICPELAQDDAAGIAEQASSLTPVDTIPVFFAGSLPIRYERNISINFSPYHHERGVRISRGKNYNKRRKRDRARIVKKKNVVVG